MKRTCDRCGKEDDPGFIWSGLCQECWWDERDLPNQPATVLPGVDLERECSFCGREVNGGELCRRCDDSLSNLDTLR